MSRKRELREEERALWDEVTRDVRRGRVAVSKAVKPPSVKPKRVRDAVAVTAPSVPAVATRRAPAFGMDGATAERLKRGKVEPQARIDLHGLTQADAHRRLVTFVRRAHDEQLRCVLVITGKGAPGQSREHDGERSGVLRRMVPRWLEEDGLRALVVGVQGAHVKHGGAGAIYVYLRRRRA